MAGWDGMTVDLALDAPPEVRGLAADNGIDVSRCEFCGGPLDADHPWRRGADGACAHEACLGEFEWSTAELREGWERGRAHPSAPPLPDPPVWGGQ